MLHKCEEEDILNDEICGPNENIMSPALFIKSALLMKFRTQIEFEGVIAVMTVPDEAYSTTISQAI